MQLVLASSRNIPDFRWVARSFDHVSDEILRQKETVCPARVPMREIRQFVRDKAAAVQVADD